ncbi:Uncharacterised protein [Bordetella pertussis]|nr:Uncharacterised protein [Bordetella pertussis]CFT99200.1 Uncharacterised protein [Bordetella pertussis]CFW01217.1 Uncharacterised protein [Bordetella pertussis]
MAASVNVRKRHSVTISAVSVCTPSVTAMALWNSTARPDSRRNCSRARSNPPGLPMGSPSTVATWSEPITTLPGWVAATAIALATDRRSARSAGASPGCGVSSTSGEMAVNGRRRRDSSSRR